jgi:tRNA pseudouridine55 synthase
MKSGEIEKILYPLEAGISHLPKLTISDKVAEKVKNGAVLPTPNELIDIDGPIIVETVHGQALAIYMNHPTKPSLLKPMKVLRNDSLEKGL